MSPAIYSDSLSPSGSGISWETLQLQYDHYITIAPDSLLLRERDSRLIGPIGDQITIQRKNSLRFTALDAPDRSLDPLAYHEKQVFVGRHGEC